MFGNKYYEKDISKLLFHDLHNDLFLYNVL